MSGDDDFWVKTKWPYDDLNEKRVQFELTASDKQISGIGVFRISQRPSGEQRIEIVVTTAPSYWELKDHVFTVRQVHANKIQHHLDQSIAEFELLA